MVSNQVNGFIWKKVNVRGKARILVRDVETGKFVANVKYKVDKKKGSNIKYENLKDDIKPLLNKINKENIKKVKKLDKLRDDKKKTKRKFQSFKTYGRINAIAWKPNSEQIIRGSRKILEMRYLTRNEVYKKLVSNQEHIHIQNSANDKNIILDGKFFYRVEGWLSGKWYVVDELELNLNDLN